MFYIVNCSGRHVSLGSIGVMLAPRQGIDLDVKFARHQTERCAELKSAISKGIIKLVRKDGNSKPKTEEKRSSVDSDIIAQIKAMLDDAKRQNIDAIAAAVAEKIGSSNSLVVKENAAESSSSSVIDEEMDSATLDVIHKRAVERMARNIEGQAPPEKNASVEINIDNKLDELEGLL